MEEKKHVFVVCAYKESEFLEDCIISLIRQSIKSDIIIITSTPNELITRISERYNIPLFINQIGGITQDWNFAFRKAEASYVTIAHQDDIYLPRFAEKVIQSMEESKLPIISFTNYLEIRDNRFIQSNRLLKIKRLMLTPLKIRVFQRIKIVRRRILSLGCPICCPSVTFSKKNIQNAPFQNGFRSDEDWEAWEKLSRMNGDFIYIPEPLMGHRIHEGSETTSILEDNARSKEDYLMFRKFWPDFIAKKLARAYSISEESNNL